METLHNQWMKRCFTLAGQAKANGESPVGSVIVIADQLIAEASERSRSTGDITCHAEVQAIRLALKEPEGIHLKKAVLYSTHEPCILCSYVIRHHGIRKVIYAEKAGEVGGIHSFYPLLLTDKIKRWAKAPEVEQFNYMEITDYQPSHQSYFQKLNEEWISKYFKIEDIDIAVLTEPEQYILKKSGKIFIICLNGKVCGTCGLLRIDASTYEFTKMAVDEAYRGKGLGKAMALHAIAEAKKIGAKQIELYTQKVLPEAIGLYRKIGFKEVKMDKYKYSRADTYMVLSL